MSEVAAGSPVAPVFARGFYAVRTGPGSGTCVFPHNGEIFSRQRLIDQLGYDPADCRGWNFWSWDLAIYLGAHRAACG